VSVAAVTVVVAVAAAVAAVSHVEMILEMAVEMVDLLQASFSVLLLLPFYNAVVALGDVVVAAVVAVQYHHCASLHRLPCLVNELNYLSSFSEHLQINTVFSTCI